jgi:hypothetical protein
VRPCLGKPKTATTKNEQKGIFSPGPLACHPHLKERKKKREREKEKRKEKNLKRERRGEERKEKREEKRRGEERRGEERRGEERRGEERRGEERRGEERREEKILFCQRCSKQTPWVLGPEGGISSHIYCHKRSDKGKVNELSETLCTPNEESEGRKGSSNLD